MPRAKAKGKGKGLPPGAGSNYSDILADAATTGTKWIVDSSDEGQELKDTVVLAAAHLVERWAVRGVITARDHWPIAGVLVALGDSRDICSRDGKTDKHQSMNACLLRVQLWLRGLQTTQKQADEITGNINTLKQKAAAGTLKWDGDSVVRVDLESLKQRLRLEVTDLCPRVKDAEPIIEKLGNKRLGSGAGAVRPIWAKRLHTKHTDPYPLGVGCSSFLGDGNEPEKKIGEILLALAMQIALKMAVRCACTIGPTMPCAAHWMVQTRCIRPCVPDPVYPLLTRFALGVRIPWSACARWGRPVLTFCTQP